MQNQQPCQAFIAILRDIAWDSGFTTETGWNRYGPFPHYNAVKRAHGQLADWDFYGSSVDQGILYYYFNMVLRDIKWLNATVLNNEWVHHFVGLAKPWLIHDTKHTGSTSAAVPNASARVRVWNEYSEAVLQDESLDRQWAQQFRFVRSNDSGLREKYVRQFYRNVKF